MGGGGASGGVGWLRAESCEVDRTVWWTDPGVPYPSLIRNCWTSLCLDPTWRIRVNWDLQTTLHWVHLNGSEFETVSANLLK